VPGIDTIHGFCASRYSSAICAAAIPLGAVVRLDLDETKQRFTHWWRGVRR